jgi:hypothetical protein
MRRIEPVLVLTLGVFSAACHSHPIHSVGQTRSMDRVPDIALENQRLARAITGNERLAAQIPEFGGAFWDKDGVFNVFMTDVSKARGANGILQQELLSIGKRGSPIRIRKGNYSYNQLKEFERRLSPYLGKEVTFGGVDTRVNRYGIDMATEASRLQMIETIKRLGLPIDAFVVKRGAYAIPL